MIIASPQTYTDRKKILVASQFLKEKVDNEGNSEPSENVAFNRNPMERKGILYARLSIMLYYP